MKSKHLTTKEAVQLENLIFAAKQKFNIKDIVSKFVDSINWREQDEFIAALLSEKSVKDQLKDELKREMEIEGNVILKVENMEKRDKLEQFLSSTIYPYYNEQTTLPLFN